MKRISFRIFGYSFVLSYGIVTLQDIEESVRDSILRVSKRDLPNNDSSWFQVQTYSTYGYKQIKITDFTGTFAEPVYEFSEQNLNKLFCETKKHFDKLK